VTTKCQNQAWVHDCDQPHDSMPGRQWFYGVLLMTGWISGGPRRVGSEPTEMSLAWVVGPSVGLRDLCPPCCGLDWALGVR